MLEQNLPRPTDKELEILQILWSKGPSTVREINEALNLSRNEKIGYTTSLKLMQIMHEKGILSRSKSGKTHTYSALVSEHDTQNQLVDKLIDKAFQGSAMKLVMQALGNRKSTMDDIKEIRAFLDNLDEEGNR